MPVFIYPPTKGHLGSFQVWQLWRKMFIYTSGAGICVHVDFQLLWLNNKEWDCWIVITFGFIRNHQTVPFCTSTISEWSSCCSTALVFLLIPDIMYCSQPADGYAFAEWLGTWGCCFRSRVSKHWSRRALFLRLVGLVHCERRPSPGKAASHQGLAEAQALTRSPPTFSFFLNFIYLFVAVLGLRCCTQTFSACSEWRLFPHCASASLCGRFSCCGAWALWHEDFSSCGLGAKLLLGVWGLLRPGFEPSCPALAGGFLITGPPAISSPYIFIGRNTFPHCYSWGKLGSIDCSRFFPQPFKIAQPLVWELVNWAE